MKREQQRIVANVDELLRWCDALEARLTAAQTTAAALLDATLHQILTNYDQSSNHMDRL
jgi:hypothetical protein